MKSFSDYINFRSRRYEDVQRHINTKKEEDKAIRRYQRIILETLTNIQEFNPYYFEFQPIEPEERQYLSIIYKYKISVLEENRRNPKSYSLEIAILNNQMESNMIIDLTSESTELRSVQSGLNYRDVGTKTLESEISNLFEELLDRDLQKTVTGF